jgi:hypothetical protein
VQEERKRANARNAPNPHGTKRARTNERAPAANFIKFKFKEDIRETTIKSPTTTDNVLKDIVDMIGVE